MIDQHTIDILEFPQIVKAIREHCITPYGGDHVDNLGPMYDLNKINQRLDEVSQMKDIINFHSSFPLYRVDDCRPHLERSTVQGTFIEPSAMLTVLELVEVSIAINEYEKDERDNFDAIAAYLPKVRSFPELKVEIRRTIDERGEVKDSASSKLKRVRHDLIDSKRKIIARLENMLADKRKKSGWQDDVVTQRNGRYVIPVLAGNFSQDMGILHDRSQSGATFWIEPQETVEMNNKVSQLMQDERLELDRILRALTAEIAQRAEALTENCRLIGQLDFFHAAARFADDIKANRPKVIDEPSFNLIDARHPLLMLQLKELDKVVPLTLDINSNRPGILITGPNTGGKTIGLKTIGLMVVMAQSGLLLPASDQTEVGIFNQLFADIGDEQSIELSLSTFSSHIRNIIAAINQVSDDSLILFDEIGAGTDPKEGAALAEAIILHLLKTGARLVVTTHYSHLKTLALEHTEIENASMEFDRESLAPTFRLQLGIPGSSYALEIAKRLGMPSEVCDAASILVGSGERSLSDLIAELEDELAIVREDRSELTDRLESTKSREEYFKTATEKLDKEIAERKKEALAETEQLLDDTRKKTEKLVAEIRNSQADDKKVKEIHRTMKQAGDQVSSLKKSLSKQKQKRSKDQTSFDHGDTVRIISFNQEGKISQLLSGKRAKVDIGNVSTIVEFRNLEKLNRSSKGKVSGRPANYDTSPPPSALTPEIHLRGMTVEEAIETLGRFIDNAVVNGLTQIYVIHGKGTGKLRRTLSEWLKSHREVKGIRLGDWNEGGAGVTVVKLKV